MFLRFGAVAYNAEVWLNGLHLGSHEGMFNPFEFDVTDLLDRDGENVVAVKLQAPRDDTEYIQTEFGDDPLSTPYKRHEARAISQIKGHMIDAMHPPGAMTLVPERRQLRRCLGQRRAHRSAKRLHRLPQDLHEDRREEGLARRQAGRHRPGQR